MDPTIGHLWEKKGVYGKLVVFEAIADKGTVKKCSE
jgi:hypothetical protein